MIRRQDDLYHQSNTPHAISRKLSIQHCHSAFKEHSMSPSHIPNVTLQTAQSPCIYFRPFDVKLSFSLMT